MLVISDRVKESCLTEGSGSLTLEQPFGSFQSFSEGIGNGNITYYCIENGTRWEVGQGIYNQSLNQLSRDVIFDSSDNGSKIDLTGVSAVFCTLPADKAIIRDENGGTYVASISAIEANVSGVTVNTLQVSGVSHFADPVTVSGNLSLLGDFLYDGSLNVDNINATGDIHSSGFLTLIRPQGDAGNFLHAYKEDGTRQTMALHFDGNVSPLWRFGLKTNPNSQTDPPTFAYIFARDGSVGSVSNVDNYFQISDGGGFLAQHDANTVLRASSLTGVYLETTSSAHPSFVITGPPLATQPLQEWRQSDDTILSVVDSGGKFGILRDDPVYEIDVNGSGRMETIHLTSGIYFQDGTFQDTALVSGPGGSGDGCSFDSDLLVSLANGKTFGRYEDGDVIPASGKTPCEVIQLAITEPIDPTVNLSSSSSVDFNQVNVSVTLNFNHTINSVGASVASASLEFRRGNSGSWTVLSTSTTTPDSYVHNFTDTAFNTAQLNYRYVVTDTAGATDTDTLNINPDTYSAPTISFSVDSPSATSPETDTNRERGNVYSDLINGSVSRNETYVDILTAQWQYRADGGSWQDIDASIAMSPTGGSLATKSHTPSENTAGTIQYRLEIVDEYQTSYSSIRTVNFGFFIFYGPSNIVPNASVDVRGLPDRLFTDGNDVFNLNTGDAEINFVVAIPDTESVSEVIDLDALNANITSQYVNNPFNVNDGGGTAVAYNVYTMSIAIPYSSNHRHQVTKG